jgi:hypothetical protein
MIMGEGGLPTIADYAFSQALQEGKRVGAETSPTAKGTSTWGRPKPMETGWLELASMRILAFSTIQAARPGIVVVCCIISFLKSVVFLFLIFSAFVLRKNVFLR